MKVPPPIDPRLAPLIALRRAIPLPGHDREEQEERHVLRRAELAEAVRK